ncbi:uncharacterized protein LOC117790361 isoform X2 [Drosophila innubila]|uniref:uncharacterized protein LOC117790361 isoform X2 n=1 Tax=Drosophila innubila TaxID=198719 RepID=UPI00148C4DC4|nr:uncharacterized protein LOC117790361 isoform X2 [Drosophila innubila]
MSNLQDVPLAEPENQTPTDQNTTGHKSNSLKRFFKLGKKSNSSQDINAEAGEVTEEEANKDPAKPGSISRFLTRLKGTSKTGDLTITEPGESTSSSPTAVEVAVERPVPNAKPTLKTSISSYWKVLFHRQKAANRQGAESEQEPAATATEQSVDSHGMQQVQQEQQTDPIKVEDASTVTPATSRHDLKASATKTVVPQKLGDLQPGNCIPQILEEVQVLTISDEIVDPSLDETVQN